MAAGLDAGAADPVGLVSMDLPGWPERLRAAGLRVTQSRLAVLAVVHAEPHIAADRVAQQVRTALGTVSTQAVYDALNTLTTHRILRCFEPAGSSMRFEVRTGDNHHHLVCRRCQSVTDVDCAVDTMPCALPDDPHGFVIDEAEVTYWGLCPGCVPAAPHGLPKDTHPPTQTK